MEKLWRIDKKKEKERERRKRLNGN